MMPFTPMPAEFHRSRWPMIILPTYELHAISLNLQAFPDSGNRAHICDFPDGLRLVPFVTQVRAGDPEQLQLNVSLAKDMQAQWGELDEDEWQRVLVERLLEIEIGARPRTPIRRKWTPQGGITLIFTWDRCVEEYSILTHAASEGIDPAPLGNCLEMHTIYERPADYPGSFVIRRLRMVGQSQFWSGAWQARTLEEARGLIPRGKVTVGRHESDEPSIVETWL